jgi:diaminopimelate decarboxylase
VENTKEREGILEQVQIVGALCTPVDRFGGTVDMVIPQIGDVLIFPNNGAYGLQMSPVNFLGHPLPEEKFFDF